MNLNHAKTIFAASLVLLFLAAGSALGFMAELTYPNEPGMPVMTYATVSGEVDSGDSSLFHFRVDLDPGLYSLLNGGDNFGLDKFFFNTDLNLTQSMFINLDPNTWGVNFINNSVAGFGMFDVSLTDPGTRSEYLYFDIDFTSAVTEANFFILSEGIADNGNGHFAAHIGGFDYGEFGSIQVRDGAAPVPEPGTILLLGTGMLGLALYRRFKR